VTPNTTHTQGGAPQQSGPATSRLFFYPGLQNIPSISVLVCSADVGWNPQNTCNDRDGTSDIGKAVFRIMLYK